MACQRRNRTQADADKTMRTRLLGKLETPTEAFTLPVAYRRFLRQLELEGKIKYTLKGWVRI